MTDITKYDGTKLTTVVDGTVDIRSSSIALIGKSYVGFGKYQNENFVHLLENFAKTSAPDTPIHGQLWFDTASNKLKFFDLNNRWRIASGADNSLELPNWLTEGDLWFDTVNNQLYVWSLSGGLNNSPSYILVGPQSFGPEKTEMITAKVIDTTFVSHYIIKATVNGIVSFIISTSETFTLNPSENIIPGFTIIHPGITLVNTTDEINTGITTGNTRFWGTATNSEKLGGRDGLYFAPANEPTFTGRATFSDTGIIINDTLSIFNSDGSPVIKNTTSNTITLQTTNGPTTHTPLKLVNNNILPGTTETTNIGSSLYRFNKLYAKEIHTAGIIETSNVDCSLYLTGTNISIGAISGNTSINNTLNVSGSFTASGDSIALNSSSITLDDSMLRISNSNTSADIVDIGLYGSYFNTQLSHSGLVRDASDKIWKLFSNVHSNPTTTINFSQATYDDLKIGNLNATSGIFSANINATSGIFSSSITANAGAFTSSLTANTGLFSSSISTTNGTFIGSVTANTGVFSSSITTNTGTFTSGLTANTGVFSSSITATNGIFINGISAGNSVFVGTVTGITADQGISNKLFATTEFVTRADNLKANLASPTFTGTPNSTTPPKGDNSNRIATTEYVQTAGVNPTGTIIMVAAGSTPPSGYLKCPLISTTVNKTAYPELFNVIGYTWGGSGNNFALPYFPDGYAPVAGTPGTITVGEVISHNHRSQYDNRTPDGIDYTGAGDEIGGKGHNWTYPTTDTGGTANRAAGVGVMFCIKY